jgi:ankyrin repeat protein
MMSAKKMNKISIIFLILFVFIKSAAASTDDEYFKVFNLLSKNRTEESLIIIKTIKDKNKVMDSRAGQSLITEAARNNNIKIVQFLVDNGANVDAMNGDAYTALLFSVENGNADIFNYLLNHGADICSVTKWGETAIDLSDNKKALFSKEIRKIYAEKQCEE